MKISVIIPTYKPKEYLWECLDSLVRQTFSKEDFEIIIVLNGCREPWKSELESYISANMSSLNVKLVQIDQGGVSNARNMGIDLSKGDYITFLDDDDYISDSYLQGLYEKSSINTVVLSNAFAFNEGCKDERVKYQLTDVYKKYAHGKHLSLSSKVRKYFNGPCMKLFPMTIIRDRRFDIRFKNSEDSLFMFLISDRIENVVFAGENSIYYRRYRSNSAVTTKRTIRERISNNMNCIILYTKIFAMGNYNLLFYLSRILAALRCSLKALLNR